ncbi:MAG: NTP transferase domain-containing protein [Clostridiaceae bacterium]|nr:NTP transferase domain-containing protein [Clostridiaceae bacterium]
MKALILAGGKGTRLRPLTCRIPKPMIPVVNRPLLEHTILLLKKHGIKEIGITMMYMPKEIENYFKDGSNWGVKLSYFMENQPLGTAGSILNSASFLDEPFLVMCGDCVTNMNLNEAAAFHFERKALATMVLTKAKNPHSFGIALTDSNDYITGFREKPCKRDILSDTINTGVYVMNPEVLELIEPGKPFDLSRDLFPRLIKEKLPLLGYSTYCYWSDVGSPESYLKTNWDMLDQKLIPCMPEPDHSQNISGRNAGTGEISRSGAGEFSTSQDIFVGKGTVIEPDAVINGPCVIGNNCYIGHNAVIDSYTVIGDNCIIEDHVSIKRSLLLSNCAIGRGSELRGSILGNNVRLMQYVLSYENTVIGNECVVHERSVIKPNIRIWPDKTIESLSLIDRNIVWAAKHNPSLFVNGLVSGIINVDITPEFATRLGASYGSVLGGGSSVIVSSDRKPTSKLFKYAFISGLMSVGVIVLNPGDVPTPLSRQAVLFHNAKGGVHIRRSSESIDRLEINIFDSNGANIDNNMERNIEYAFYREDFLRCRAGSVLDISPVNNFYVSYMQNLSKRVDLNCIKENPLKVFIISNCEDMLLFIRNVFSDLNIETYGEMLVEHFEDNNINNLAQCMNADVTAYIDCNGERLVLFDSRGNIIEDNLFFLLSSFILFKSVPGCLVKAPVNMTFVLEKMAQRYGGHVKRTKISRHHLLREIMNSDIYSGTINQYMIQYDAVASLIKILEFLSVNKTTVDNLLEFIPSYYLKHAKILCPNELTGKIMRTVFSDNSSHVMLLDGIKIDFHNSWIIIIPDGHNPFIHIYAEGCTEKEADCLLQKYSSEIKRLTSGYCSQAL